MADWLGVDVSDRTCSAEECERPVHSRQMCTMHWSRWYYAQNGDRIRAKRAADRQGAQRDRILAEKARYRAESRAKLAEKQRAYYHADPERASASSKTPKARAAHSARKRANRARYTEIENERRARMLSLEVEAGISIEALVARDGDACSYCRCTLSFDRAARGKFVPHKATIDHVIPISRGGAHVWANVVLACWRCNMSKGNRLLTEWVRRPLA